jgi:hypothetical protein
MRNSVYSTKKTLALALAGRKVRKHLNADSLIEAIRQDFQRIPDSRSANSKITLDDALMSAFAMFQLKDQSLLAFDERRREEDHNLRTIYGLSNIPCDSQMRTILDPLPLPALRGPFLSVFRQIQRGKDFEKMAYYDGHYLLSADGTGFYSSEKVSSSYCMGKKSRNGKTLYHQQMYAASFVKPGCKVVIPVFPEMITQNDGSKKNDCERNAAKRFFKDFRREHPHLKVIVVEDALSSNGPHIKELKKHNLRFILGAKPKDHKSLFNELNLATKEGRTSELLILDPENKKIGHSFKYLNNVALNQSHPDLLVNVLEYFQIDSKGKLMEFSWVTDIEITDDNVYQLMRAGRARWKIENETFNTLKNQGYNLGHNYGLGKKNLSGIFTILMMLAFLVDQAQQLSCWLFQAALVKGRIKRTLWELIRSTMQLFEVDSMERVLRIIVFGSKEAFKT